MTRTKLLFSIACFTLAGALHAGQPEGYIHNIYLTTRRPNMARKGRWVFDISSPERMDDLMAELAGLGVNAMTYHSAYRIDGADYTPRHPELKRARRWPAEAKPVEWFLDACRKHGIAGSLAVFIYPKYDHHKAVLSTQDMIQVFRRHPAMAGYVPPIEAGPARGHDPNRFLGICRWVKTHAPKLTIMDYPNGPYSPSIVRIIVQRGASGLVDVENVQFHAADKRLKNFFVSRGMTHLVMGMASKCRSIVHTHYRYGGSKPWLYPKDAYKVRQGAVLTATPHGTSIFSFQHAMWGADSGPDEKVAAPLWRRREWYKGILSVQRMLPPFFDAKPIADAAVVIPANTHFGGQEIVERYWMPFTRARVFAQMISYAHQLSPTAKTIVCPALPACNAQQLKQLESLAAAGRTLVVPNVTKPAMAKLQSARARRILGVADLPRMDKTAVSPAFLQALGGVDEDGYAEPVSKPAARRFGKGKLVRIPSDDDSLAKLLPQIALEQAPAAVQAEGLPKGYMLELWRTREGVAFVKILATAEGLAAKNVMLTLPSRPTPAAAWLLDRDRAEKLECQAAAAGVQVRVPRVNDEYALVLLGATPRPTLRPAAEEVLAKAGQRAKVACAVVNTTGRRARGTVVCAASPKLRALDPGDAEFDLAPDQRAVVVRAFRIPADAERRPHFVQFRLGAQVQRCMVFPADGRPQVISHEPPPKYEPTTSAEHKPRLLGPQWAGATAGDLRDDLTRGNVPGVCFLPGSKEWDAPAEYKGKMARYAEILPRLGGANFLLNNPNTGSDVEIRITYCSKKPGALMAYDGKRYHKVGPFPQADDWTAATFRVPKELLAGPQVDRPTHPGLNMMFAVAVDGVYVHRIEARKAE